MSLALIFYHGKAQEIEWKHRFHLALIFYHGRAHVEWKQYCLEALHPDFGLLSTSRGFFGERLFGSSASKYIRLVGLRIGS
jgi:hypothetical protein